jgi:type II secretory pathway pseudopilin PulG
MRTGDGTAASQRGFTYLILLFALVIGGAGLAAAATAWSTAAQRQRELESMFRGQQIADALGHYRASGDGPGPKTLADLLEDPRSPGTVRHLRRLYEDPLTSEANWVLLRDAQGAIEALHSRSTRPAVLTRGIESPRPGEPVRVSDRIYRPRSAPLAAAPPASSAAPGWRVIGGTR